MDSFSGNLPMILIQLKEHIKHQAPFQIHLIVFHFLSAVLTLIWDKSCVHFIKFNVSYSLHFNTAIISFLRVSYMLYCRPYAPVIAVFEQICKWICVFPEIFSPQFNIELMSRVRPMLTGAIGRGEIHTSEFHMASFMLLRYNIYGH